MLMQYKNEIISAVKSVQKGENQKGRMPIKKYVPNLDKKHELAFFIKPEVTLPEKEVNLSAFLDLISKKFEEYGVSVNGIYLLDSKYLEDHNIMAKHYGVINDIANNGVEVLSENAKKKFEEIYNTDINKGEVLGAFQFLNKYDCFNTASLDIAWESLGKPDRLASGTYAHKFKTGSKYTYVINGFHPNQLAHYTRKGRSIIVMPISSDTDWEILRSDMIGKTDAPTAKEGSIRKTLYNNNESIYHMEEVSQSYNGVHLSAGGVESLAELIRFLSDYDSGHKLELDQTAIGQKLLQSFDKEKLIKFVSNPKVDFNGEITDIFDVTEEINLDVAIKKLEQVKIIK